MKKSLFCTSKQALLPCKTMVFGTQNMHFCNTLTTKYLCNRYFGDNCLRFYSDYFTLTRIAYGGLFVYVRLYSVVELG